MKIQFKKCSSHQQKGKGKKTGKQKTETATENKNKMTDSTPSISIITLNVNSLNLPIKRQIGRVDQETWHNYMLTTKKLISNMV